MQRKQLLALCVFAISGLMPAAAQAQKTMFVHTQSGCLAHDASNILGMDVSNDTVSVGTDAIYLKNDVDSITFTQPRNAFRRMGWWGDLCTGNAACYHEQDTHDQPSIETWAADSLCQKAYYYENLPLAATRGPRRVGSKWRYVRGTLSGRHKLAYHFFDIDPYGGYSTIDADKQKAVVDLTPLLGQHPMTDVRRAVNFWYRPDIKTQMPTKPLFGKSRYDRNGEIVSHRVTFPGDSVVIDVMPIHGWVDGRQFVVGDSMTITYQSDWLVRRDYEEFSAVAGDSLAIDLRGRAITVIETFEPVAPEEVRRWFVRFDLDMYRPAFIRSEQ